MSTDQPTPAKRVAHQPARSPAQALQSLLGKGYRAGALIIDVRSTERFLDDHIPGARHLDTMIGDGGFTSDLFFEPGYEIEVQAGTAAARLREDVFVYGEADEDRADRAVERMACFGIAAKTLEGGYATYKEWAKEELERLTRSLSFCTILGPAACGKTKLLRALSQEGFQVIDFERIVQAASRRGGEVTQALFESYLVCAMHRLDPALPVWIEADDGGASGLQLPESLLDAIYAPDSACLLSAPMNERLREWVTKQTPGVGRHMPLFVPDGHPLSEGPALEALDLRFRTSITRLKASEVMTLRLKTMDPAQITRCAKAIARSATNNQAVR